MAENLHELVVRRLNEVGRKGWQEIADVTGVSVHTIIKVASGEIKSPRYETLEPLVAHFRREPPTRTSPDSHASADA